MRAMRTELLRFNGAVERDPAIDAWMKEHAGELGAIAHQWTGGPLKPGFGLSGDVQIFHSVIPTTED